MSRTRSSTLGSVSADKRGGRVRTLRETKPTVALSREGYTVGDYVLTGVSFLGYATPTFVFGALSCGRGHAGSRPGPV